MCHGAAARVLALAVMAGFITACGERVPRVTLQPVSYAALPGWAEDRVSEALAALARSCRVLTSRPAEAPVAATGPAAGVAGTVADWKAPCAALADVPADDDGAARAYFERWFNPYRIARGGKDSGLFTGYYEAELRGAWRRRGPYRIPIHGRPDDLVDVDLGRFLPDLKGRRIVGRVVDGRLEPYPDRAQILSGELDGLLPVLLWVDDVADAFLLHIQGSGRVRMADGGVVRVGYAGTNGRPFVSIGRLLLKRGALAPGEASAQGIRDWIRTHADEALAILEAYPRYVFFRIIEGDGPVGAQGVPLTPGRSLAVDSRFVPLGVPVWLDTTEPGASDAPLRRLMVSQDTGAAIKGPVRGDVFWGTGDAALARAGVMAEQGRYYLLLPRSAAPEG